MSDTRILMIDRDEQLCLMVAELGSRGGYQVDATPGIGAIPAEVLHADHDLVLLEARPSFDDTADAIRSLRQHAERPILLLASRDDHDTRIAGFEAGANDVMAKPLHPRELMMRITTLLGRIVPKEQALNGHRLVVGPLAFDVRRLKAFVGSKELALTGCELRALEALMRAPGRVISRADLTERALGRQIEAHDRAVDTHISRLRSKIGRDVDGRSPIRNIRGMGYVLVSDWEPASPETTDSASLLAE